MPHGNEACLPHPVRCEPLRKSCLLGNSLNTLQRQAITKLCLLNQTSLPRCPLGGHIASGSRDGTILIRKQDSDETEVSPIKAEQRWVNVLVYSPSGDIIASGGLNMICIWDGTFHQVMATLCNSSNLLNIIDQACSADSVALTPSALNVLDTLKGFFIAVSEGNLDGIYVTHCVRAGIYSIQCCKEFVVWFNSGAWTNFPFEPLLPAVHAVLSSLDGDAIDLFHGSVMIALFDPRKQQLASLLQRNMQPAVDQFVLKKLSVDCNGVLMSLG
ncbi:hypothetical protein P692DRAFT_20863402 [Suillus brevipes Sb2]|nr:hypothetical protein P692DRAFT_20863402 [Suillus brevipes Sb2]